MKGCNFLKSVVSFFVKFRNSVCINPLNSQKHVHPSLEHISGGDVGELSTIVETQITDSEHMKDSHWTDKMTQSNPKGQSSHENKNEAREIPEETPTKDGIPTFRKQSAVQLEPNLECELLIAGGILDLGAGKPIDHLEGKRNDDSSPCPTALILNFTDLDAVPCETNLNRIFSHFGRRKASVLRWFSAEALMQKQPSAVLGNTVSSDLHLSVIASSISLPQIVNLLLMQQSAAKEMHHLRRV